MIEKAARALCLLVEGRDDVWDDLSADDRSPYFDMVRVVLCVAFECFSAAITEDTESKA